MKSKIKRLDGTAVQIDVSLPKKNVEDAFKKHLENVRKTAKIPGFREGKAPIDLIEKKYAGDVMEEVKQRLVPEAYQKALEDNALDPLSYPEISPIEIDPHGDMVFTAKVDTYPEVNLRKYKGLKAEREKVKVSDKETKEALEHIAGIHAEFTTVERPVKKGDFGICDVETLMDGKVIAKKRENMWIEADKEASMLGMGESLCGLNPPAEKEIEAELPENYPDKKYAGKKAVFSIKLKEVKERKVPELDEKFAKKLG
ncbi:MAG: trigger factor, partial [Candidatus Omnitrophica bacterium]|nr:trigger factor [Candidatus Omnitrophota bacterium]